MTFKKGDRIKVKSTSPWNPGSTGVIIDIRPTWVFGQYKVQHDDSKTILYYDDKYLSKFDGQDCFHTNKELVISFKDMYYLCTDCGFKLYVKHDKID